MQIGALHQTRFEHTSIWRALFHNATAITLPLTVEVLRLAHPLLIPGKLILLLLLRRRHRATFLLGLGH
jgi:hypothetical protein